MPARNLLETLARHPHESPGSLRDHREPRYVRMLQDRGGKTDLHLELSPNPDTLKREHEAFLAASEHFVESLKFTPDQDPSRLDYRPILETMQQNSTADMAKMFDYTPAQHEALNNIFQLNLTKPHAQVFSEQSSPADFERARVFNIGYVGGVIERMILGTDDGDNVERDAQDWERKLKGMETGDPVVDQRTREKVMKEASTRLQKQREQIHQAVDLVLRSPESFERKREMLVSLMRVFFPMEKEGVDTLAEALQPDRQGFLLSDLSPTDEINLDANRAGDLATETALALCQNLYNVAPREALEKLQQLLNAPDFLLQKWATDFDPSNPDELLCAQVIIGAGVAANLAWIQSKIPQGLAEQHKVWQKAKDAQEDPEEAVAKIGLKKGKGRYTFGKPNQYYTTFGNMSTIKGWPAVLIDMDQIRAGLRVREQQLRKE